MSKLQDKLNLIEKDKIKKKFDAIESANQGLSTKEKLEKLVNLNLKREKIRENSQPFQRKESSQDLEPQIDPERDKPYLTREYSYSLQTLYGNIPLSDWYRVTGEHLAVIFGDDECLPISPQKLVFFDTETTGLAGGTGTIPFMLGFGYFDNEWFRVKVFLLNDLAREDEFLDAVDQFLEEHEFTGTVTYNGKSFDFPLMETRYILQRKRFPLLRFPHMDFLFAARTIWKNTYESRKLGYLGDILLGISRDDDIDASQIPMIYFNYLRSKSFGILQKVVEHNALDLLGLAGILLRALKYQEDFVHTSDEGEIYGTGKLKEKYGNLEEAGRLYEWLAQRATREEIKALAVKALADLKKRKKLFHEASELWQMIECSSDRHVLKELSIHFENREKNYFKALEYVRRALENFSLSEAQRIDFEKRMKRLSQKMKSIEKEE